MKRTAIIILIIITWLWVGLTTGLSFIEAPLKFQAPDVTLQIGLGIGRLVFGVLNKIELAMALLIIAMLLLSDSWKKYWLYIIPIGITIIDNSILLPILDARAQIIIDGGTPPESSYHIVYIVLEVVKLIGLVGIGIHVLKQNIISKL